MKYRAFFHPFAQKHCTTVSNIKVGVGPTGAQTKVIEDTKFGFDPTLSWHHATSANIFYASDSDAKLEDAARILENDPANSILYLIGQCSTGSDDLYSLDLKASLNYEEVLGQLERILPGTFSGYLKVYACRSGATPGPLKMSLKSAEESIRASLPYTTKLACYLSQYGQKTWKGMRVVGYTEALTIVAMRDDLRSEGKFITLDNETAKEGQHRYAVGTDQRAKQFQVITKL